MEESRQARLHDWLWFLFWAIASSIWCVTAASQLSGTFDEPIYLQRGLEGWRTGSHKGLMQLGTMPLPVDLDTLPIYLWERWRGFEFDPVQDFEKLLPWARSGTLVFWWLLLVYGRLAGRSIAGVWGGRLAVALLAVEPSLLAHASLATTDIAVTACLLALLYHFRTGRESGWFLRVGLPMFWFAAAVLAKASGMVFGPICICVIELERLLRNQSPKSNLNLNPNPTPTPTQNRSLLPRVKTFLLESLRPMRRDLWQIGAGGMLLVFLYCGSDWKTQPSFVQWAHSLTENGGSRAMVWLADNLQIFSNAGEGIVRQIRHNVRGHGTYILGEVAPRAVWYYFPVALSIKLSLAVLLLPLLVLFTRARALTNWMCCAALVLLVFSVNCRVQIGIRLVLPLVAFAIVGSAAAIVEAIHSVRALGWSMPLLSTFVRKRLAGPIAMLLVSLAGAGLCWTAVAAARTWPDGLCYINEAWGGSELGYMLLSDSNYDWGQGLKELAGWQQKHGQPPMEVWYFGTDPSLQRMPVEDIRVQAMAATSSEAIRAKVQGHYVAVSTTLLHGSVSTTIPHGSAGEKAYLITRSFLLEHQPVDRTRTFLIYDFTGSRNTDERLTLKLHLSKEKFDH